MKAKRQTEVGLNSATMLDGFGGHVSVNQQGVGVRREIIWLPERYITRNRN